ncbi:MAG: GGDEF domain-containing protein [Lachnospiraceae bacterium]|nr:GGDEF domain-containing protein [Lachnospiraceae bacterium]
MLKGYKIIALCLSAIQDASNICFISELNDVLCKHGYRIFLYHMSTDMGWCDNVRDSETLVFNLIDYSIVDTVVIMDEKIKSRTVTEHIIHNAKAAGVPIIIVDGQCDGCTNVRFDYRAGIEKIVRHVVTEHNPQKLHFMAGNRGNQFSEERIKVFERVLEEYGIGFDRERMVSYGDFWARPTIKATLRLIENGHVPEAIICANDVMAINVAAVLIKNGYRIPEDIIITGFDGIEEIHMTQPRITTCCCDFRELAGIVIDLIRKGTPAGDYYAQPRLMLSESCGCTYDSKIDILNSFSQLNSRFYRYQDDNQVLTQIAEDMQGCRHIEEVPAMMGHRVMNHMCCYLNQWCTDNSVDPMTMHQDSFDDEMYILYNAEAPKPFVPMKFARKGIIPNLDELLERRYPLIFMELDFMNVTFGYVCFCYKSCDSTDYTKIPQIVTAVNMGIGGLLNKRYQNYLAKRIEHIYIHDSLTGLYNRLGFNREFEKLTKRVREKEGIVTVVLADLDGLKGINDNYGHAAGDNAIHTVAIALKSSCPEGALCVRFGGDEMLAVMEGDYEISVIREKMKNWLEDYNSKACNPYTVSASLGILSTDDTEELEFEDLLKRVDALMYQEKRRKKK